MTTKFTFKMIFKVFLHKKNTFTFIKTEKLLHANSSHIQPQERVGIQPSRNVRYAKAENKISVALCVATVSFAIK